MYLQQIKISNFRLFNNLTLRLTPGLNILVGENDSGKTAIIDAIRYTLGNNSSERTFLKDEDFFQNETKISIQLKFSDVENHAHIFVEHLSHEEFKDDNGKSHLRSVLYINLSAEKSGIERRGYPYIRVDIKSGLDGEGPTIESEIREFLSTTYLKPLRDAEGELSSGRGSRLSQILNSSKEIKKNSLKILEIIASANVALLDNDLALKKSAENIRDNYLHKLIFEADKSKLSAIIDIAGIKDINGLTEGEIRRHLRTVLESLSLSLSEHRRKHGLGYHNILFMAAELLLLEQEAENELPMLLIEEPEAHLHVQLQMKLLQFIESKSKNKNNPNGIQCILTTHSPNISSKADPSTITMMRDGKVFSLLSCEDEETELKPNDYTFLKKFLDATKANIFFARSVLFVEGPGEHILLPTIANLLERPFEDFGVSIVKYDNSGSWKRFARIFLRKGKDTQPSEWNPTKICVLRDLDLWPDCAEEKEGNPYGFKKELAKNKHCWRRNNPDEALKRTNHIDGLSRQNILVKVSDDWTFEYCLAKFGLFEECYEAINGNKNGIEKITGTDDEKATYILGNADKTDFAYKMIEVLEKNYAGRSDLLQKKLPKYITEGIEHVTSPLNAPSNEAK